MKWLTLAAALALAPLNASAQDKEPLPTRPAARPAAKPAAKDDRIATVNGVAVPKARMDFMMLAQRQRGTQDNADTRAMMREELVNREIIVQEAQKSGIARSAEVQNQVDIARQEIIVSAYLNDWVRKHPISDAELQKEYERARAETGDKEYRARHILVDTEEQAKSLIAELKKGGKFAELAEKNSKDAGTRERGGDLDWSPPARFEKSFGDALGQIEKGRFSEQPVRTRYGYHVILVEDVRQTRFPSLAEVKPQLQQQMVQNRISELVRGLRAKAKVE
jgi:peptidyl-prolyl cis-trans isomerase C